MDVPGAVKIAASGRVIVAGICVLEDDWSGQSRRRITVPVSVDPPTTGGNLNAPVPVAADQSNIPAVVVAKVCVVYAHVRCPG